MDRAYAVIEVMERIAAEKGVSVARIALAWLLHQPQVTSVIVGAKRLEQLDDSVGAAEDAGYTESCVEVASLQQQREY